MATFTLNNWSAINLSQFSLDVNVDPLITVFSYGGYVTSYSSTSASGYFGDWRFKATGVNFTSSNPIFKTFSASLGDDFIKLSGSISDSGGTITSMSFSVGTTEMSFTGSIRLNSNFEMTSSTITSATIAVDGYKISYAGNIAIDAFGNVTGTVTSFLIEDQAGNQLSASGVSINAALFDSYADPASHSDLSALMTLLNFSGNDVIQGGANTDALDGIEGSDIYLIAGAGDHAAAEISDTGVSGIDEVRFTETALTGIESNTLTLFAGDTGIERVAIGTGTGSAAVTTGTLALNVDAADITNALTIIGNNGSNSLTGTAFNDTLIGNLGNDTLTGNAGDDTLNGGTGADTLVGGSGNDTYVVDNVADVVTEQDGEGTDTVQSSITHALAAHVENLTLTGAAAINGTGNELANVLTGNIAANLLDGGTGADTMDGGKGSDTYIVDDLGDTATESFTNALGGGVDLVKSSVSFTLGNNIDHLTLTGSDNIDGTGNSLNNTLIGNAGNNALDGGLGADTLKGGLGNDSYTVNLNRVVIEGIAYARLEDSVTENLNEGTDTLKLVSGTLALSKTTTLTLGANIENLDASDTQETRLDLTGNALNNILTGNAYGNVLNGGLGIDTLVGGAGNDTYVVDNAGDTVTENDGEGTDLVQIATATASGSYTLADHVENGTLINAVAFHLTGNALDNILTGNAYANTLTGEDGNDTLNGGAGNDTLEGEDGNDTLNGGTGADTLVGGLGDDIYIVDNVADAVTELDGEGTDTVQSSITHTLAAQLENLTLTGSNAINGTGNELDNTLIGNASANILDGSTGADTMDGGKGNDTFIVDDLGDTATESFTNALGGGTDLVKSSVSFTLGNNLDNLTLTGSDNIDGTGNSLNNTIIGNSGNNVLTGGDGIDTLIGGLGDDTYVVGLTATGLLQDIVNEGLNAGTDTLQLTGNSTNVVATTIALAATLEHLDASGTGTSKLNLTGNALANTLTGNDANNTLNGGLGADTLIGGLGDDTYIVDNAGDVVTELSDEGSDTIRIAIATANGSYTLTDHVENGTLVSAVAFNLTGNDLDNTLTGNGLANTLTGLDGNDTLNGGAGADTLVGGDGDDTYIVDNAADAVTELDNEGTDTVQSTITYTLSDHVENLTLIGSNAINGTGNSLANTLIGNAAANVLDGSTDADTMEGGKGNDIYIVDNENDLVTETLSAAQGGGIDTVKADVSYTLAANVDRLTLTGTADIDATGNALNNILTGNSGNNVLDGDAGMDTLIGGLGDDLYKIDLTATGLMQDVVSEAVNGGTDTIELRGASSNAVATTLTLAATVEHLDVSATGTSKLNLTGNALANTLTGNDANNTLNGGLGADTLIGGLGDDTYIVDNAGDVVTELSDEGSDTIRIAIATANGSYTLTDHVENGTLVSAVAFNLTGNDLDNTLTGNGLANTLTGLDGNDTLNGGAGADTLVGGDGDDTYIVDNAADAVTELDGEGTDTVQSSITHALAAHVENLTLTGLAAINGTGNELANVLTGNIAANLLDGGTGADTMDGGKGNDTYIVDDADDIATESLTAAQGGGTDTVKAGVSYTLGVNIDRLTLTGSDNIDGTGNELANIITGNSGNNVLDGGIGTDTLIGGLGDDTYVVDVTSQLSGILIQDKLVEGVNGGIDTIILSGAELYNRSVIYTLSDNFENLDASQYIGLSNPPFSSATGIAVFGNTKDNVITGNSDQNELWGGAGNDTLDGGLGEDTLYGGAGSDILIGGEGSDRYVLEDTQDVIYETGSFGSDTIIARFDIDLNDYIGIENVILYLDINEDFSITGNAEANGLSGNGADNILYGEAGNDYLNGNTGNDTLDGGTGNDSLFGFTGNDILMGGTGDDTLYGDDVAGTVYSEAITVTGSDTLTGGDGADVLYGGRGTDTLSGGDGEDTYVFDTQLANTNIDTIQDFLTSEDIFQLDNDIFSSLDLGQLDSNAFYSGTSAVDADTRIIYNSNTGALLYDADGTGSTAAVQFATLSSASLVGTLTEANFVVVD